MLLRKRIFRFFRERQKKTHKLTYLFWECTWRCNLSCRHCGSDCYNDSTQEDMPLADFLSAVDTIPAEQRKDIIVVLTGGEPLMRTDIEQIGKEIRKRGMRWGMVSNGQLYTKEKHIALLNVGMQALTFSLDGLEENHNWFRNAKANFSAVDKALDFVARSSQLSFDVVTCVHQRNLHELEALYAYLVEKGVKAWRLFTVFPIGRAKDNPELFLSNAEFTRMMDFIAAKRKLGQIDVKFSCEGYVGNYEMKVRDSFFFCRAGINIGSILLDGSIGVCPNNDRSLSQGNIYRDNFYHIWNTQYAVFRNRDWKKTGICSHCKEFKYCEGNGMHYRHSGNVNVSVCHHRKLIS